MNPMISNGMPNIAYNIKSNVPTEYKIAATNAAHDFFNKIPKIPKHEPTKNIIMCGQTIAVAIAPAAASTPSEFIVPPTK